MIIEGWGQTWTEKVVRTIAFSDGATSACILQRIAFLDRRDQSMTLQPMQLFRWTRPIHDSHVGQGIGHDSSMTIILFQSCRAQWGQTTYTVDVGPSQ